MMWNEPVVQQLQHDAHDRLLQEAQKELMLRQAGLKAHSAVRLVICRAVCGVGRALVSLGHSLQRFAPEYR